MFCDKCGEQLADTASFCNKCGNTVKKRVVQAEANYSASQMSTTTKSTKKKNGGVVGVNIALLLVVVIAIGAVVGVFAMKSKPNIYGSWSDATGTVSFTFYEDGKIRISGLGDTLGVNVFTFSEVDADTLLLSANTDNVLLSMVNIYLDYEISGDTMTVSIADMHYQLVKRN